MQLYFTLSRPSSFVGLKLKMFYLPVFCKSISHLESPIAAPGDVNNVYNNVLHSSSILGFINQRCAILSGY